METLKEEIARINRQTLEIIEDGEELKEELKRLDEEWEETCLKS